MAALIAGSSPLCYYLPTHGDSLQDCKSATAKTFRMEMKSMTKAERMQMKYQCG